VSENLNLVRSIFAAWERGDYSSIEWALPEIEYVFADGPDPGSWTDRAAIAEAVRSRLSPWEDFRFTADEYREIDEDRVLVLGHNSGRGRTSGIEITQLQAQGACLFHVRGGKVTKFVRYFDRDRAFADLGLAPTGNAP
jgi:ketosteroid isomerase-like protein